MVSKRSGKEPGRISAEPNLDQVWAEVEPFLDDIMRQEPSHSTSAFSYPTFMRNYTMIFNFCNLKNDVQGLYKRCDVYFSNYCRQLFLDTAQSSTQDLIQRILDTFHRYTANVKSADRLFVYLNRHYVRREEDEGRGWMPIPHMVMAYPSDEHHSPNTSTLRNKKMEELKKWGYTEGGSDELWQECTSCAEAASPLDRVVPIVSLAHRRFRLDFIAPQIQLGEASVDGDGSPHGRLAMAIGSMNTQEGEKRNLAQELINMFRTIGISLSHPLYVRLSRFAKGDL